MFSGRGPCSSTHRGRARHRRPAEPCAGDFAARCAQGVPRRCGRRARPRPRRGRRRVRHAAGPLRLRQDHGAADDRRVRAAHRGHGRAARPRRHARAALRSRRQHRIPGLRAVPAPDAWRGNVEYALRIAGVGKAERSARAPEALATVRLEAMADRGRGQLSGGQRQRVALARALVDRPRVLLLDEPLGALDLKLREQMQIELTQIQRDVGITFVIVTHDQDEALTMPTGSPSSTTGRIEQVGARRRGLRATRRRRSWPASSAPPTCSTASRVRPRRTITLVAVRPERIRCSRRAARRRRRARRRRDGA